MPLFFNAGALPGPNPEYVAWVDVMGTQSSMGRSLSITANFVYKLHIAALQAPRANIHLYPVMDGFYAAAAAQQDMLDFLRSVFHVTAEEFVNEEENKFRFVVRGALAFGPVIHGRDIPAAVSPTLHGNMQYRESVLLGVPMVQAHLHEKKAPPFGIYVHESARAFAPAGVNPLHHVWWTWDSGATHAIWSSLQAQLLGYFDWCEARHIRLEYDLERIRAHRAMVAQYFV